MKHERQYVPGSYIHVYVEYIAEWDQCGDCNEDSKHATAYSHPEERYQE